MFALSRGRSCYSAVDWTDSSGKGCDESICDTPYGGFVSFNPRYVGTTSRIACCACNGSASAVLEYAPPISNIVVHYGHDATANPCVASFNKANYSMSRTTLATAAWSIGMCNPAYNLTAHPIATDTLNWAAATLNVEQNETQIVVSSDRANVWVQDASTGHLMSTVDTELGVTIEPTQCALSCWIEWQSSCHETQLTLRECSSLRVLYEAPQFSDCGYGRKSPKVCLQTTRLEVEMRDIWGDGWNGGVVACTAPQTNRELTRRYAMLGGSYKRHRDLCD